MSLVAAVLGTLLFLSQLSTYMSPTVVDHVAVDTGVGEKLRINFNITFYALNCAEANLDAMDVAGEQQNDVDHDLIKERLDQDGKVIGEAFQHRLDDEEEIAPLPADYCGPCYGAAAEEECCNSCDDVRAAYVKKGWNTAHLERNTEQCRRESRHPAVVAKEGEGCRISGFLLVNKVAGNFHVALGDSTERDTRHIHQFNPSDIESYNASHRINHLSFGEVYPGMKNPLDDRKHIVENGYGVFQYYIKVVPTIYENDWETIRTNQYSATDQFQAGNVNGVQQAVLPGVFFVYGLSPFMVRVTEQSMSFLQFLTGVCAIVGGVFTVAGIVDSCLHASGVGGRKR